MSCLVPVTNSQHWTGDVGGGLWDWGRGGGGLDR